MAHVTIHGDSCFTPADTQKLTTRLNKVLGSDGSDLKVTGIRGNWVYYTHLRQPEADAEILLRQLLPGVQDASPIANTSPLSRTYHISPRIISPWSSKATSIAGVCGLRNVMRIERGRAVVVDFNSAEQDADRAIKDLYHDRMTEFCALDEPDVQAMFAEESPRQLEVIPIAGLKAYSIENGLALDESEMDYLRAAYAQIGRDPYDIE